MASAATLQEFLYKAVVVGTIIRFVIFSHLCFITVAMTYKVNPRALSSRRKSLTLILFHKDQI